MTVSRELGPSESRTDTEPIETVRIPWERLTPAERDSITQGILRADHTFRYLSVEDARQAGQRHRESIAIALRGLGDVDKDMSRPLPDRLAVAAANFIAHLHDDLPPGPASELGSDDPAGLEEQSEAERYRLAAMGKAAVNSIIADRSRR